MPVIKIAAVMAFMAALAATEVIDTPAGRWEGRWVEVAATAYTPTDPIDSEYHASKGARWRWVLADGRTNAKRTPYGIAVKLTQGGDGRWRPALPFGTRIYVPTGHGYLDRSRAQERVFQVDDGSAATVYQSRINGRMHVDLRWVDTPDAVAWSGAAGHQVLRVFIIERDAPAPAPVVVVAVEPVTTWPAMLEEATLPPVPVPLWDEPGTSVWAWEILIVLPIVVVLAGLGFSWGMNRA